MLHKDALDWLLSVGGSVKPRERDGVSEVIAAAHGLATIIPAGNLSDPVELRRCEIEAIWQLKQLLGD